MLPRDSLLQRSSFAGPISTSITTMMRPPQRYYSAREIHYGSPGNEGGRPCLQWFNGCCTCDGCSGGIDLQSPLSRHCRAPHGLRCDGVQGRLLGRGRARINRSYLLKTINLSIYHSSRRRRLQATLCAVLGVLTDKATKKADYERGSSDRNSRGGRAPPRRHRRGRQWRPRRGRASTTSRADGRRRRPPRSRRFRASRGCRCRPISTVLEERRPVTHGHAIALATEDAMASATFVQRGGVERHPSRPRRPARPSALVTNSPTSAPSSRSSTPCPPRAERARCRRHVARLRRSRSARARPPRAGASTRCGRPVRWHGVLPSCARAAAAADARAGGGWGRSRARFRRRRRQARARVSLSSLGARLRGAEPRARTPRVARARRAGAERGRADRALRRVAHGEDAAELELAAARARA